MTGFVSRLFSRSPKKPDGWVADIRCTDDLSIRICAITPASGDRVIYRLALAGSQKALEPFYVEKSTSLQRGEYNKSHELLDDASLYITHISGAASVGSGQLSELVQWCNEKKIACHVEEVHSAIAGHEHARRSGKTAMR